jgi:hypothetical protein
MPISAAKDTRTGSRLTLDLLSVRRASVMCVYLLRGCALVERDETVQEVVASGVVVVTAVEIWEVVAQW